MLDLEHHAVDAAILAAEAMAAYALTREAFGIGRAVRPAQRGETWTPRDLDPECDALLLSMRRTV